MLIPVLQLVIGVIVGNKMGFRLWILCPLIQIPDRVIITNAVQPVLQAEQATLLLPNWKEQSILILSSPKALVLMPFLVLPLVTHPGMLLVMSNNKLMKKIDGFSLIELLIVISIIAILGAIALSAFSTARKQARDIQRKGELNQYKVALESYYAVNNQYPISIGMVDSQGGGGIFASGSDLVKNFMAGQYLQGVNVPEYQHRYITDSGGTIYKLMTDTEIDVCFEICANGKSGKLANLCSSYNSSSCDL